jgi:hypothetical protein
MLRALLVIVAISLPACSKPPRKVNFLHTSIRETYLIQPVELEEMQFYISERILAQDEEWLAGGIAQEGHVVLIPSGTKGVVLETGPNWLRASFEEGGTGVYFVSDTSRPEDRYWLATTVAGRDGIYKVKDLPEAVIEVDGVRYKVVQGADSYLLLDRKDFDKLVESRQHIKGRQVPKK